jgi:hypothetical protein
VTTVPDGPERWVRSSYSPNGTDCVEVEVLGLHKVRDSKHPEGDALAVDMRPLLDAIRAGRLG